MLPAGTGRHEQDTLVKQGLGISLDLKGTEMSLGRFVSEYFTPLTLDTNTGVVSDEDTSEIWEDAKEVVIEKVRRNKDRTSGGDSTMIDAGEVETRI